MKTEKFLTKRLFPPSSYLMEEQLRRFKRNDHDDVIDALAYMDVLAFPPRQRGERSEREAKGREYLY